MIFLFEKQDTSFCSISTESDCRLPHLFLHKDLAIPRADETSALGGSKLPSSSSGETSNGRLLVKRLGIYTFMGRRMGRAGRAMNAAASPSPLRV
jgi:hypothetical protein